MRRPFRATPPTPPTPEGLDGESVRARLELLGLVDGLGAEEELESLWTSLDREVLRLLRRLLGRPRQED